jgi:hypothetical protein
VCDGSVLQRGWDGDCKTRWRSICPWTPSAQQLGGCYAIALQKAAYSTHLQGEVLDGASLHATSCQKSNAYRYCLTTVCFEIRFHVLFLRVLYCTVCGAQPGWSSSRSSALHANPGTACALLIATRVGAAVAHRGLTFRSPPAASSARTSGSGRVQLDHCSYRSTVLSHRDTSWLPARIT